MDDPQETWCVYVLRCRDGSLYCGATNNLERRVHTHALGKGAGYTRSRLPVEVIHSWGRLSRSAALREEAAFKKLSRRQKLRRLEEAAEKNRVETR